MKQTTADRLYLLLVDRLRVIGGTRHAAEDIAAEIDGLTAEAGRLTVQYEIANRESALHAKQLAEARAEVERLRLPAEAWETLEAAREAGRTGTEEDEDAARGIHKAARDAARAAKERKP